MALFEKFFVIRFEKIPPVLRFFERMFVFIDSLSTKSWKLKKKTEKREKTDI
jgi:hypothetical protein